MSEVRSLVAVALPATCARFLLAYFGAGAKLANRIEVTNAFNRIAGVREGIALMLHGLSPYTGSAFRGPPLLLPVLSSTVNHPVLYCVPFIVSDLLSAFILHALVKAVRSLARTKRGQPSRKQSTSSAAGEWDASTIVAMFLWNPLVLCTCIAGSSATFGVCAVLLAVYSAVRCAPVMAAVGVATASYLDPHHLLLTVPISIILFTGIEELSAQPTPASVAAASKAAADPSVRPLKAAPGTPSRPRASALLGLLRVALFWGFFAGGVLALLLLSDVTLRAFADHPCMGWLPHAPSVLRAVDRHLLQPFDAHLGDSSRLAWLQAAARRAQPYADSLQRGLCSGIEALLKVEFRSIGSAPASLGGFAASNKANDWVSETYGGILMADDVTPNIGIWWYFLTEMFQEFKTFFKFVLHAQSLVFVVPMAIRLWHRPLFLVLLQLMLNAFLKPYPTVSDVALYLTLLPLFAPQLRLLRGGVYVAVLMCLLAVLGPAMWHQWIYTGSANANFFYAITVAWGAAQLILTMLTLSATLKFDRLLAGKPLKYAAGSASEKKNV